MADAAAAVVASGRLTLRRPNAESGATNRVEDVGCGGGGAATPTVVVVVSGGVVVADAACCKAERTNFCTE